MEIAHTIGGLSHDPTHKVGCVIVKDRLIISTGYNGCPSGTPPNTRDSNGKTYDSVIHAEMNAILHAHQSIKGATAYTTLSPCMKCAIHLYQAGIETIYYSDTHDNKPDNAKARVWLNLHGVNIKELKYADTNRLSKREDKN